MQGILVVDKPTGWTSFDVIAKLRGVLGTRTLGHSGTLDPMATGVLPVFVGGASKAVDLQPNHDKTYEAVLRFGLRTDTGDITGETLEEKPVTAGEAELLAVLPRFVGETWQIPPMYSAVKVNGVPLYKIARKNRDAAKAGAEESGQTGAKKIPQPQPIPERKARPVTIHSITYDGPGEAKNEYRLTVACSKGTYIRTLLEDIGAAVGQAATMSALRRTKAGLFGAENAHTLEEIIAAKEAGTLPELLLPVETVFAALPALTVNAGVQKHLENGCPTSHYAAADGRYRCFDETGKFLGLAKVNEGVLNVEKLFIERI